MKCLECSPSTISLSISKSFIVVYL